MCVDFLLWNSPKSAEIRLNLIFGHAELQKSSLLKPKLAINPLPRIRKPRVIYNRALQGVTMAIVWAIVLTNFLLSHKLHFGLVWL